MAASLLSVTLQHNCIALVPTHNATVRCALRRKLEDERYGCGERGTHSTLPADRYVPKEAFIQTNCDYFDFINVGTHLISAHVLFTLTMPHSFNHEIYARKCHI